MSQLVTDVAHAGGSALGGAIGGKLFGKKGAQVGKQVGKMAGGFLRKFIPFEKGGRVVPVRGYAKGGVVVLNVAKPKKAPAKKPRKSRKK
jgi:hypothetical protein